ncbi:carboxypeptidase C (cathepsin A) [Azospirillum sp. OGB3]|uniref:S10 family peptidase n=1 Tax=Azospirillum sp. OGB3 TaxID=2587012 RepID=UPI0016063E5C|nr:septum formation initiator [Azospirillum sp. OGB3]MBB3266314.1 carboxypeptidase C (cathepsin A) [Azospirillum sp. OGB3]
MRRAMNRRLRLLPLLAALALPPLHAATAQDAAPQNAPARTEQRQEQRQDGPKPAERAGGGFDAQRSETRHQLPLPSGPLAYTAVAEFLPLRDGPREEAAARVFTVTYTLDGGAPDGGTLDGAPRGRRPVAFVFNGGPGASSAYLHLGALGPKVVGFNDDGSLTRPPAPLLDNPDSWLAFTDLVFVDPVGTGYSRGIRRDGGKEEGARRDEDPGKRFWSVDADSRAMAEIVRLWLTRNGRWESPKFLVGESYGGFRIAKMANRLIDDTGIAVNGLIMVSPVVDFATIRGGGGLLVPALRLPSYAASAAANGLVAGTAEQAAEAAERYALTGYLTGLAGLDYRRPGAAQGFFAEVARTTGLPEELVTRFRGEIPTDVFARELLRGKGRVASVYDGTFTAADPDPSAARLPFDPFLKGTVPTYTTAFAAYAHEWLGVRTEVPFELLSDRVNRGWEWPRSGQPSAVDDLQTALTLQPALRVLIAHGRTDLITPYMASRWVASRLELPEGQADRVAVTVHEGGHMMYTRAPERAKLAADARALIEAALR